MSKKKAKHAKRAAGWGDAGYYGGMGGARTAGMGMGSGMGPGMGAYGAGGGAWDGAAPGAAGFGTGMDNGLLHGLQGLMGSRQTEQFVIGALIGAAAVYVLGDEEMRAKLMRGMVKLYSGIASGFEEIKEQMADIKAEVAAAQREME